MGNRAVACFKNTIQIAKDIFKTLQLTIICFETNESVRGDKKTLNPINCAVADFFKGFNGKSWLL